MSVVTILICSLVLASVNGLPLLGSHARATSSLTVTSPPPQMTTATSLWQAMASTSSAELSPPLTIDDPMNSATTTTTTGEDNTDDMSSADDICVRCYDKVKVAQDMVENYEGLLKKQRKLISRKKAAAEAAEASANSRPAAATTTSSSSTSTSTSSNNNNNNNSNKYGVHSSVRSRSLMNQDNSQGEQIVISTLRVARSAPAPAPALAAQSATGGAGGASGQLSQSAYRPLSKDKFAASLNKKDVDLERLKRELERQKDFTCKTLLELRDCLEVIARECIGNLHFHTYELFADQWHGKLRCPYSNNPKIKPMPGLRIMDFDTTKTPVPRPISNAEEVRIRMHKVLGGGNVRPLGVILEPIKQQQLQSFNQQQQHPQQQQQQQQQHQQQLASSAGPYQGLMRDFSGHHFVRDVQQLDDNSINMVNVGKILLVPCCFAIMVALVALASLHYTRPDEEDDENEESRPNYTGTGNKALF